MLFLVKLIRNFFKQIKSDLTPAQLGVGAFLGALAALTPFGGHLVAIFFAALLFNCSMATFLLIFGLLKPIALLLGPASFNLGVAMLQDGQSPYATFIRLLTGAPILAWLGFDRYVVAGGLAIAGPIAGMLGLMFGVAVSDYRRRLAPKLADAAWFEKAMKNWFFRSFKWVLTGKDKAAVEPKKRFILLRPFRAYMIVLIPLLLIGLSVGAGLYAQIAVQGLFAKNVSKALGVQCSFGKVEYSFFAQRFAFQDFQLPDPSNTQQDMIKIGGFETKVGFVDLLRKRYHLEKLSISDIGANVVRKEDGKLNVTEIPGAQPTDPAAKSQWDEWIAWLTQKGKDADWSELWTKYQEYRKKSAEKRKEEEAKAKPEKVRVVLPYDPDLRWDPGFSTPLFRADLLEVKNLAIKVVDKASTGPALPSLTSVSLSAAELSSAPGWNGAPSTLVGTGLLSEGKSGKLSFDVRYLPSNCDVQFRIEGVPLVDLKGFYEKSLPVRVDAGTATLGTKAGAAAGILDGRADLSIDKLKIAAKPGETKILGLDPQASGYAIQGINAYGDKLPVTVAAAITGPIESPSIQAKLSFLEIAKKGLEMMGKAEMQKYIDQIGGEVDSLKKAGATKLAPVTDDATKAAEALKKGDTQAAAEAAQKAQEDAKKLQDSKKDAEQKKDDVKKALDAFKKPDPKKKEEPKK